jgi:hypothetical protein
LLDVKFGGEAAFVLASPDGAIIDLSNRAAALIRRGVTNDDPKYKSE